MKRARPRLLHVITSLSTGGAEVMLRNVAIGTASEFETAVLSLTTFEPIGRQLLEAGIPTSSLGARGGTLWPRHWRRLQSAVAEWAPDIVHSWMYHSNVAARLAMRSVPSTIRAKHVAAIRGAVGGPRAQSLLTRAIRRLDARLSPRFDRLVFNSDVVRDQHGRLGYHLDRSVVIPNGFDTTKFRPNAEWRQAVRQEIGVSSEPVIGMVARYHPVKGQRHFIEAAALMASRHANVRFLLVGHGCERGNAQLMSQIERLRLVDRVILLGERSDVARIASSLDVGVCASISESFPNAVGEAMACGVPCIVTDVGDCRYLVGESGWVVPAADVGALADAMDQAIAVVAANDRRRAVLARERIENSFSLESVVARYSALYRAVAEEHRGS